MTNEGLIETKTEFKFPEYEETIYERKILEQKIKNRLSSLESILLDVTFQNDAIKIHEGRHAYLISNQQNNFYISDNSMQIAFNQLTISNNAVEIKFLLDHVDQIMEKFHENNQRILILGKKIVD